MSKQWADLQGLHKWEKLWKSETVLQRKLTRTGVDPRISSNTEYTQYKKCLIYFMIIQN